MIVYLGMPKCASTWLWNKIIHNFNYDGIKEPHTLVELGKANNAIIDFSTNNEVTIDLRTSSGGTIHFFCEITESIKEFKM